MYHSGQQLHRHVRIICVNCFESLHQKGGYFYSASIIDLVILCFFQINIDFLCSVRVPTHLCMFGGQQG